MKEIFDDYILNSFGEEVQATFKLNQFAYNYQRYFPELRESSVLDIGIGRGEMLSCMRAWNYENYLGIDISPSTVNFCLNLGLNALLVEDSQAFLLQHPDEYDVITLLDVLEHIKKEQIVSFLKAVHGALKTNGILIIQVPNLQAPDGYLHRYNDITHEIGFIEHSLSQVLIAAGFKTFNFQGFEEFVFGSPPEFVRKFCRFLYWKCIRLLRYVNGNINPHILNPVFSAIACKTP